MAKRDQRKSPPARTTQGPPPAAASPRPLWFNRIDDWVRARAVWVALGIFLISLIPRALYFQQAKDTPLKVVYQWELCDMEFFDTWARHLAAGDWLCDTVLHPYHDWHRDFAKGSFSQYPDVAARYYALAKADSTGIDTVGAYRAFINDTYSGKVFHQEPLYPYLMAATYKVFGPDQNMVYLWQFLLGACSNALLFLIGLRLFGGLAGLLAALAVLLSGPVMVFEMVLLRTTLTVFFTVLLLYLYLRLYEKPNWRNMASFGFVSGLALLGQSYFLLFLLPALGWLAWANRGRWRLLGQSLAAFSAALLLTMSPVFYRNAQVGVPVTALASNAAMTYIPSNTKNALPLDVFYIHQPTLVRLMHDTGGHMGAAMTQCLGTFDGVGDFVDLYLQKLGGMFMAFELTNNMNYYAYREYSDILASLPQPYFLIAPLGIAGFFLAAWRLRRRSVPFLLMTVVSMAPMIIGCNFARYRTPFVVLLSLLAAWWLVETLRLLLERHWKTALASLLLAGLAFWYTSPLPRKIVFPYYNSDFIVVYKKYYLQRLQDLEKAGNFEEYAKLTAEMLGYVPDYFFEKRISDPIRAENEAGCCYAVSRFLDMHTYALESIGRKEEAARYKERSEILRARSDAFYKRVKKQ